MTELESLTKTLIQVVGSLQDLLSKKGSAQATLEPEPPKLKKTPEMTYNEFVNKALSTRKPVEVSSKKASFRLQEDLELLSELSTRDQISLKTFEEIAKGKRLNRSAEALRARYHEFLYKIDEKEMKKIVAWIEREGVEGFLVWEGDEMRIQINDPSEKRDEKKRSKPTETEGRKQDKSKKLKAVPVNCK